MKKYLFSYSLIISVCCLSMAMAQDSAKQDPLETVNRSIYEFNQVMDDTIILPVAQTYRDYVPQTLRQMNGHFMDNLWEPVSALSSLLQGKVVHAGAGSFRFIINSTLGLFGLFDVATLLGVVKPEEDLGQTFYTWGWEESTYLMIPFLGPYTLRDLTGEIIDGSLVHQGVGLKKRVDDPIYYSSWVLDKLQSRADLLEVQPLLDASPDPYVFIRDLYYQDRLQDRYDGNPPSAKVEQLSLDELDFLME